MNKSTIAIVILVLAVVLGGVGVYALTQNGDNENSENTANEIMEKENDAMMEGESESSNDAMQDESMEKETDNMEKNDAMMEDKSMEKNEDVMEKPESNTGSYITFANYEASKSQYNEGDVVLFFNASWCPTCKALTKDIEANLGSIPSGTTIVSVDYDTYTDLRKKYGVTYQHTLVQVNPSGEQVKKWSGSPTLSSLLSQI